MKSIIEELVVKMREKGLRVTQQRKAILKVLAESNSPCSAEETHSKLGCDACDLVTAYRCLVQFEKVGIVEMGGRETGTRVYFLDQGRGHHHHLTCRDCGRTERIDLCMGEELEAVAKGFGFVQISHIMEVFGKCPSCTSVS